MKFHNMLCFVCIINNLEINLKPVFTINYEIKKFSKSKKTGSRVKLFAVFPYFIFFLN